MKVGGICWVISTGKRSITGPRSVTSDISACGPPVDEPITSARGACVLNARCDSAGCAAAGRRAGSRSLSSGGVAERASGDGVAGAERRSLAPSERIF